jgi:hypothetical protein
MRHGDSGSVVPCHPLGFNGIGVRVAVLARAHVADAVMDVVLEAAPAPGHRLGISSCAEDDR